MSRNLYSHIVKPVLDFGLALAVLVVLSPVILILIIVLCVHFRGSPFFTQVRAGRGGRPFRLFKFRSMQDIRDANGELLADHLRLTQTGKVLRATSLDELPQLINVLKGEMSLIGPRPLLVEYLPLYSDVQQRRHEVLPGITGWAQVNGRNGISWREKLDLDVWYTGHISFGLDMRILWMTLLKVVKQERINAGEQITMQKFEGNG